MKKYYIFIFLLFILFPASCSDNSENSDGENKIASLVLNGSCTAYLFNEPFFCLEYYNYPEDIVQDAVNNCNNNAKTENEQWKNEKCSSNNAVGYCENSNFFTYRIYYYSSKPELNEVSVQNGKGECETKAEGGIWHNLL